MLQIFDLGQQLALRNFSSALDLASELREPLFEIASSLDSDDTLRKLGDCLLGLTPLCRKNLAQGVSHGVVPPLPPLTFEPHPDAGVDALIELIPPVARGFIGRDPCVVSSRRGWSGRSVPIRCARIRCSHLKTSGRGLLASNNASDRRSVRTTSTAII